MGNGNDRPGRNTPSVTTTSGRSVSGGASARLERLFREAEQSKVRGDLGAAIRTYQKIVRSAAQLHLGRHKARAMRNIGILWGKTGDRKRALRYLKKSVVVSRSEDDVAGRARAYNSIGTMYFDSGEWEKVRTYFHLAMEAANSSGDTSLLANIHNNLGAMSNIQGNWNDAIEHYTKSIEYCKQQGDLQGLARNYNNIGLTYRDMKEWERAAFYYNQSIRLSEQTGDESLKSNCTLNHVHVLITLSRLGEARERCDAAYESLMNIGEVAGVAESMMLYGMIYTRMEKWILAERHLEEGLRLNREQRNLLGEAECCRELAMLYQSRGKNKETLRYLAESFSAFEALKAARYLQDVDGRIEELEVLTFDITREMGAAVESKDTYTFGHSQRVAFYAVELAKALRLPADTVKGVMVAAYLHDLGKVKVLKRILQSKKRLSVGEFRIIQMHPEWGIEMLDGIDFPWDVKPLIRHHQEKWDGSGYPDGLAGEEIPLVARIIAVADTFDALTTDRPYRKALSLEEALGTLKKATPDHLERRLVQTFLRILRKQLPQNYDGGFSSLSVSSFMKLWRNGARQPEKKGAVPRRGADLSTLVKLN